MVAVSKLAKGVVEETFDEAFASEPKRKPSLPCRTFHLGVIPSRGVLVARCNDCDAVTEHGEILLVDAGREEKVAQGDWDALWGLCVQMNGHGKGFYNDVGYMLMGKPGPQPWQSIEAWIQELMLHGERFGSMPTPSRPPDDFEHDGWRFSFNGFPLSKGMGTAPKLRDQLADDLKALYGKGVLEVREPEPKRPGLLARIWDRLRLGGGPR